MSSLAFFRRLYYIFPILFCQFKKKNILLHAKQIVLLFILITKMKKYFLKTMFALMCGCVMTMGLVACGSDDDDNNNNNQQSEQGSNTDEDWGKLQSAVVDYTASIEGFQALKHIAVDGKVMLKYIDNNGQVQTKELTSDKFSLSVNFQRSAAGNIQAGMIVYVTDVDSAKVAEVFGRQAIKVDLKSKCVLNYEKKQGHENSFSNGEQMTFNIVEGLTDEERASNMSSIMREIKRNKTKFGVCAFASYCYKVDDNYLSSVGEFWRVNQ